MLYPLSRHVRSISKLFVEPFESGFTHSEYEVLVLVQRNDDTSGSATIRHSCLLSSLKVSPNSLLIFLDNRLPGFAFFLVGVDFVNSNIELEGAKLISDADAL